VSELLEQMKLLNEDHKPDGWPAVRMSEINALVSMIKSQGEQLSKANERVKEFDQENKEFTMLIANLVRRDDVKTDLLQNPTFEKASVQLNKFAIEKKIEALENTLRENSRPIAYPHGHNTDVIYSEDIEFDIEQLRKEQECEQ